MAKNVDDLSTTDIAADLLNAIDGHVVKNYFSDNSPVSYETIGGVRTDEFEVIAEDAEGNRRKFNVSVREA